MSEIDKVISRNGILAMELNAILRELNINQLYY